MPKPVYTVHRTTARGQTGILIWLGADYVDLADLSDDQRLAWILKLNPEDKVKIILRLVARIRG